MKIDIDNLKISIDKLDNLLIDYEKIYKNFYHEMVNIKSYWHDNHANAFFERIQKEKKENIIFYKEFKAICDLYKYIFNKYQNIGKKIEFENFNDPISDTILLNSGIKTRKIRIYILWNDDEATQTMTNADDTVSAFSNNPAIFHVNISFTQITE